MRVSEGFFVLLCFVFNSTPSVLFLTFQFCTGSLSRFPLVVLSRSAMVRRAIVFLAVASQVRKGLVSPGFSL